MFYSSLGTNQVFADILTFHDPELLLWEVYSVGACGIFQSDEFLH